LLGLNSDWQVCGEAVDGADAVEKSHQLAPDLILMDFLMPQMDGVQAAREIAKAGSDIPILLVTLNLSSEIMELARNAGLRGAMSKSEISKLPYAIKALQRGETFSMRARQERVHDRDHPCLTKGCLSCFSDALPSSFPP
jgi:NarL family two-component system response regulator LiaR